MPMPPPIQSVTRPYWPPVRARWCSILTVRTAPVAPMGCPRATAPPTGFIFSSGISSVSSTAIAMDAKASFASTASRSSTESPAFFRASLGGGDHPRPHKGGVDPAHGGRAQPARHGHPEFLGLALVAHEHHCRSVVDARSVGGRYRAAILLEDRL